MKLITEVIDKGLEVVTEDAPGGKKTYLEGPFIQLEVENKNHRIYPSYIDNSIKNYIAEKVDTNRAYGEISHPQGPTINLDRVSHLIKSLTKEGNTWYGKALLTETPCGNIAKGLLASGASLGVSTRGMGSLKPTNEGVMVVQPDYMIVTAADLVSDPSAPGAFVKGIMENVEWFFNEKNGEWICEKVSHLKHRFKKMSKRELDEARFTAFHNFLTEIRKV